jgi:hypothetical protein
MNKSQKITRLEKLGYQIQICMKSGQVIAQKMQSTYLFNSVNHCYNFLLKK